MITLALTVLHSTEDRSSTCFVAFYSDKLINLTVFISYKVPTTKPIPTTTPKPITTPTRPPGKSDCVRRRCLYHCHPAICFFKLLETSPQQVSIDMVLLSASLISFSS